ncbi:MAG: zinc dependent phospholipase C family protein [Bacillota bacterium]
MLIQSHIFIARKITSYSGNFNYNLFYLGNIAPDFIDFYQNAKHEFKYASRHILNEIHLLENTTDINVISFKMGVITHYLTDFFCKAHNCDKLLNNLWDHFQYESLLHRVLISMKNEIKVNKKVYDVEEFLRERYENYLTQEPSVVLDIVYSMEVCQCIVNYILQNYSKEKNKQIA